MSRIFQKHLQKAAQRMESNTSQLIGCDNTSTKESSLLILNNDCLMNIFELLHPTDFINLAKTCNRLWSVAPSVAGKLKEVKEIELAVFKTTSDDKVTRSKEQFSDILAIIGGHVRSFKISYSGSDFDFDAIRDNCKQLSRLELIDVAKLPFQHFNNLRELKIGGRIICRIAEVRNLLTSNPNIESLQVICSFCSHEYIAKIFELLQLLPKLKTLELKDFHLKETDTLRRLAKSIHLTKLSLTNCCIQDEILEELATNVVTLELDCSRNAYKIDQIRLFQNLQVLHLHSTEIPESTFFPPTLRFLLFDGITMSCNQLIAIVRQLRFLEEFQLDYNERCQIWYQKPNDFVNYKSDIFSRIIDGIGERDLKIIYPDIDSVDEPYLYNSNHLQIIRRRFWPLKKVGKPFKLPNIYFPV